VRQRPLWRFFPTRDGEWVLWRWRDFYYDTSTQGDYLIGWLRSFDEPLKSPEYYPAEQFRKEFHKPNLVAEMLRKWDEDPRPVAFLNYEPPAVTIRSTHEVVQGNGVTLTLTAVPRGDSENHALRRVLLWVNDYQFKVWDVEKPKPGAKNVAFRTTVFLPRDRLRSGANLLTLQCYNQADVRGEAKPIRIVNDRPPGEPDLYGVFIGVGNYRKASPRLGSLHAADDAESMYRLWTRRSAGLYKNVRLRPPLLDGKATRTNILAELKALEGRVKPDDRLVFHIGGHGTRPEELARILKVPAKKLEGLGSFLYCCADFNVKDLRNTTVSFDEFYEILVRLPCHKVLLVDACHAGDTRTGLESMSVNPIRVLTQDGVGPIILAACEPQESAYEDRALDLGEAFGLFAIAVRRTMEERFEAADKNRNAALEPGELFGHVHDEVQRLLQRLRDLGLRNSADQQHPIAFLPGLGRGLALVRQPTEN
jgi:hypothetical protein